jgi:hypothetical protein
MVFRLGSSSVSSSDTVVSLSNPGRQTVNFLLEFYESIASNSSLYPTWRSKVFGYAGDLAPGLLPSAWINYSTVSRRGNLMVDNISPVRGLDGVNRGYEYFWQIDGWWRILSDGDLAVNGYVQSGDKSFSLNVVLFENSGDLHSEVQANPALFPRSLPYPDVEEERRRLEGATPERPMPVLTPTNIDDPENQVSITYRRSGVVAANKCVVILRNPPKVTLKKIVRFGTYELVTVKPLFQPQIMQASKEIDIGTVSGKKVELWLTGAFWIDFKKYEISINDTALLGGGYLYIDWNRDWPK